jgi:hypothetical protein
MGGFHDLGKFLRGKATGIPNSALTLPVRAKRYDFRGFAREP